jgi:hypothetical protein
VSHLGVHWHFSQGLLENDKRHFQNWIKLKMAPQH